MTEKDILGGRVIPNMLKMLKESQNRSVENNREAVEDKLEVS